MAIFSPYVSLCQKVYMNVDFQSSSYWGVPVYSAHIGIETTAQNDIWPTVSGAMYFGDIWMWLNIYIYVYIIYIYICIYSDGILGHLVRPPLKQSLILPPVCETPWCLMGFPVFFFLYMFFFDGKHMSITFISVYLVWLRLIYLFVYTKWMWEIHQALPKTLHPYLGESECEADKLSFGLRVPSDGADFTLKIAIKTTPAAGTCCFYINFYCLFLLVFHQSKTSSFIPDCMWINIYSPSFSNGVSWIFSTCQALKGGLQLDEVTPVVAG